MLLSEDHIQQSTALNLSGWSGVSQIKLNGLNHRLFWDVVKRNQLMVDRNNTLILVGTSFIITYSDPWNVNPFKESSLMAVITTDTQKGF